MKAKITLALLVSGLPITGFAQEPVPEPSSVALFAAGGLAIER
jgi:hypothetical protein